MLVRKSSNNSSGTSEFDKFLKLKDKFRNLKNLDELEETLIDFCCDTSYEVSVLKDETDEMIMLSFFFSGTNQKKVRELVVEKHISVGGVLQFYDGNDYHSFFYINKKKYDFSLMDSSNSFSVVIKKEN